MEPDAEAYRYIYHMGFGDCDPHGIAYTGALLNAALRALDRFMSDVTGGRGWFAMSAEMGMGMPFVHLEADFASPVRGGADLHFTIQVSRVGRTSVGLRTIGWQGDRRCFTVDSVSVITSREGEKQPLPDWLRAALQPHLRLHG
ncbi:thioesterase family protein [uncultured Paracoccus sp.]|uniref:acyl-CoA thioesterase n=1 Tax=uncultured Paracoccus sp. TaxID=189685 RepID=UPI0026111BBC|nr:thioesterase family protein [uncultured Paracoccus sp.]